LSPPRSPTASGVNASATAVCDFALYDRSR
jgi:hypothetical protein